MKFEEITLETNNSFHRYLVEGECRLNYNSFEELISLEIFLSIPILFIGQVHAITINGVGFDCFDVEVQSSRINAKLMQIDSQEYTRRLKTI